MSRLSISLLGPFQASLDDKPLNNFATEKTRALLAYLAVERDHSHSRSALAGLLWPDQPEDKARQSLRQTLLYLRQALGDEQASTDALLEADRESVQFDAQGQSTVDVAQFVALDETCQEHRHARLSACLPCLQRLTRMVELYRGDFLSNLNVADSDLYEEWALLKREWLRRRIVEALSALTLYEERRGDYAHALGYAQHQVELEPWREEAHRALMRLLAFSGQRSAALAQYRACREALARELDVEPTDETAALFEQIRADKLRAAPPYATLPLAVRLPEGATAFVGRQEELNELAERLAAPDCRLLVLVGPGGIGKTRLALRVAADQVGLFAHGVYVVPLAAVSTTDLVMPAIAEAVACPLSGRDDVYAQLNDYLCEKEMLLVLDNLEHLLPAAAALTEMLKGAPGLKLLVTSRERLDLKDAWTYEVEGLPCPPTTTIATGQTYDAVELFSQSARRTHRHFDPTAEMPGVVRICQLVEGMPLGIELAAAWTHDRTCAQIADEIARSLDTLSAAWIDVPERHRSMRAAFEYSWRLISDLERTTLSCLSVFHGGFTLHAANQVAGAGPELLAALADRSLLRRSGDDRFEMHELLRQYTADKLTEQGEIRGHPLARHSMFYLRLLQEQEPGLQGAEQAAALAQISAEIDNVRAAWRWAASGRQAEWIASAIKSLGLYYEIQSRYREGFDAFKLVADEWTAGDMPVTLLGRIWAWQGRFAYHLGLNEQSLALEEQARNALDEGSERVLALNTTGNLHTDRGDYANAELALQEALTASQVSGNRHDLSLTLASLVDMAALRGQFTEAEAWAGQGLEACQQTGDRRSIAVALGNLGRICGILGEYERAGQYIQAALDIYRALDSRRGVAASLHNLSTLAYIGGDYAQTRQLRLEALEICRDIGFRWGVASALKGLGDVARQLGDYEQALRYLDESLAIHRALGSRRNEANLLNSLAAVAREQGSLAQSWQFYRQALQIASDIEAGTVIVAVLDGMAGLLAAQGQDEQALEILAFALAHPAGEQQSRADMERLQSEVAARLPARTAQAAQQRGLAGSLAEIIARTRVY